MLVEINLLPKREEKNMMIYFLIIFFAIILAGGSIFLYSYLNTKKQDLKMLDKQVVLNQKIIEEQQKKLADYNSSNSVLELENAVKWAKDQPFSMVYVLQQLTKILPQRGFVLDFEMDEENVIKTKVQFDSKSEAAYYLNSILDYPWVDEAVISEAKTYEILKKSSSANTDIILAIDVLRDAKILPRYYAEYEIRLNVPELKNVIKKEKKENGQLEEGGSNP